MSTSLCLLPNNLFISVYLFKLADLINDNKYWYGYKCVYIAK